MRITNAGLPDIALTMAGRVARAGARWRVKVDRP